MSIGAGKTVTIVGAGLAGCLLACYLARHGYRVNIYERRGDPRRAGYIGGRSINLAISARGLWGLDGGGVGLRDEIMREALPMKGRVMHSADTSQPTAFQPYSKDAKDAINSISRGGLNIALIHAAEKHDNVEFFFNQRCLEADIEKGSVRFIDDSTGTEGTVEADLIIGADGAFSAVRGTMQKIDRCEYSQSYLSHGYKELHIPPVPEERQNATRFGKWAMDPTALHIWPRGSAMMIALPNPDGSFTCTLFWPFEGEHSFSALQSEEQVLKFFQKHYPDAVPLMPTLAQDFLRNPTSSLVTVKCWPWVQISKTGKATALIGDAAHAIVPFFGQGINCGFEDVRVLSECLEKHRGDIPAALHEYQELRKPNADAIARMALQNFIEMRDKVGSKAFLWRKHLEHFLHDLLPSTLIPRYNLVSFSTVPYTEAEQAGKRFDIVIRALVIVPVLAVCFTLGLLIPMWVLVLFAVGTGWWLWEKERARVK